MPRPAKLSMDIAADMRARAATGEHPRALANAFGVTRPTVDAVLAFRIYRPSDQPRPARPAKPRPDRRAPFRERILEVLRGSARSSGLAAHEIAESSGLNPFTAKQYLRDLRGLGLVERVGRGADTRYRLPRAPVVLVAPRGDRPRRLGFGSHLRRLREQAPNG